MIQMEYQTVKTLIRLLLEEQSDLGLHCLHRPICPKSLDRYGNAHKQCRRNCAEVIAKSNTVWYSVCMFVMQYTIVNKVDFSKTERFPNCEALN